MECVPFDPAELSTHARQREAPSRGRLAFGSRVCGARPRRLEANPRGFLMAHPPSRMLPLRCSPSARCARSDQGPERLPSRRLPISAGQVGHTPGMKGVLRAPVLAAVLLLAGAHPALATTPVPGGPGGTLPPTPQLGCGGVIGSCCEGETLKLCVNNRLFSTDCRSDGRTCLLYTERGGYACGERNEHETLPGGDTCQVPGCVPDCGSMECGLDGCGGACGICPEGGRCNGTGFCEPDIRPPPAVVDAAGTPGGDSPGQETAESGGCHAGHLHSGEAALAVFLLLLAFLLWRFSTRRSTRPRTARTGPAGRR
jgi:hypothetical protein